MSLRGGHHFYAKLLGSRSVRGMHQRQSWAIEVARLEETWRRWWNLVPRRSWNHNERNNKIEKNSNLFFLCQFKVSVIKFRPYCYTGSLSVGGGVGGEGGVIINYANYFGGSTFLSAPGRGTVSPKLVGQNKNAPPLPSPSNLWLVPNITLFRWWFLFVHVVIFIYIKYYGGKRQTVILPGLEPNSFDNGGSLSCSSEFKSISF